LAVNQQFVALVFYRSCPRKSLQNQNDPCKHGLHHKKQIWPGEVVTHQIKWTKKDLCEIVYYAKAQRLCDGQIREDLLGCEAGSSGGDSGDWPIARVQIAKPPSIPPKQIHVASWPNPQGRTMKIRVYWLRDCELEVLNISHETLEKIAHYFSEGVYRLDVHCTNQHTSLLDLGKVMSTRATWDASKPP
jgi:hypothetical protein